MMMEFICEKCQKEYSRVTYTARDSKQTKEYWREKAGTEYGLCYDCYQEQKQQERAKASMEAAAKAKEINLPELQGSEKQVAWANVLRQNFIEAYEQKIEKISTVPEEEIIEKVRRSGELVHASPEEIEKKCNQVIEDREKVIATMFEALHYVLSNKTESKWYIDNRDENPTRRSLVEEMEASKSIKPVPEEIVRDATVEATIVPENAITPVVAEIKISDDKIVSIFEKNDTFIAVVKALNYKWSGSAWERKINELTGLAADRAAELGNKLLNAGIPIIIMDEAIRDAAIQGEYEPECNRWVLKVKDEEKLKIKWWEKNDRLYQVARKLPGSKWDSGVIINIAHYKEVEEFASLYGFMFAKNAKKAIENEKERLANITTVRPVTSKVTEEKDGLKEILNSGSDILDDLKD
jgi:hypothetical protein